MGQREFLFDSRSAIEELLDAGVPGKQAVAYVRLLVGAIELKLAHDRPHPERSPVPAGNDIPFDTRAAADELIAAGAPEPQADALARLLGQTMKYELVVTGVVHDPPRSEIH